MAKRAVGGGSAWRVGAGWRDRARPGGVWAARPKPAGGSQVRDFYAVTGENAPTPSGAGAGPAHPSGCAPQP